MSKRTPIKIDAAKKYFIVGNLQIEAVRKITDWERKFKVLNKTAQKSSLIFDGNNRKLNS